MEESVKIPSLDGLRAVAIGFVFISHMQLVYLAGLNEATIVPLATVAGHQIGFGQGSFGVTVFFFLSGYLITTLLRVEFERSGRISLRDFYLRRVLRIFPPLYLALLFGVAVTAFGVVQGWHLSLQGLLSQALYLTNYYEIAAYPHYGATAGSWVLWSLAIEEHFYLVFPVVLLALLRWRRSNRQIAIILLAVCAVVLVWRLVLAVHFNVIVHRTYMSTDTRIDAILFGCVLAMFENPMLDRSMFSNRTWTELLLPIGLVGIAASWFVGGQRTGDMLRYTAQSVCLIPVFVCAIRRPDLWLFRPLSWAWVRYLGLISYVFYLIHDTVLIAVQQHVHAGLWVQAGIALAITIGLAALVRELVEKPSARLRRRLSHTERRPAEPVREPVPAAAVSG
jgi:peptidoglycan/LPS O-acetylase OafA/YrhL